MFMSFNIPSLSKSSCHTEVVWGSACTDPDVGYDWKTRVDCLLVGGFNPIEKYESKCESSPSRGENKNIIETTT